MTNYQQIEVRIRIGKKGITPGVINEIKDQLKKYKVVKIKMLQSFTESKDRNAQAVQLAQECGANLSHMVGGSIVLEKC